MFKKQEGQGGLKNIETVIGPSVKVKGDFHGQGNVIIEGIFEGHFKTNGDLQIGEKAKVVATVEAKSAKISGEVRGNVKVKGYLELSQTAKIFGDIEAANISIAQGAILNGKCSMSVGSEAEKKEEPSKK